MVEAGWQAVADKIIARGATEVAPTSARSRPSPTDSRRRSASLICCRDGSAPLTTRFIRRNPLLTFGKTVVYWKHRTTESRQINKST